MASILKIKRSAVRGKSPTTADLQQGEIALNTRDKKLFSSDGSAIFEIGSNTAISKIGTLTLGNTNPFTFPTSDGASAQVLETDGSGTLSWSDKDSLTRKSFNQFNFTSSNNQTVFEGTDDFGKTLIHDKSNLTVHLNGILLKANTDYTYVSNTSSITLTDSTGPDEIVCVQAYSAYLSWVNVDADITTNTQTTSAVSETVVDSWGTGDYRSAKYIVQMTNNANNTYQTSEVMVLHDGSDTYITEYGAIKSLNTLGSIDSDIDSGSVRLKVTPINSNTTIKVIRTSITI
jgi:archaellum component FlaF (FlaF/FlaG flagellin family)